MYTRFDVDKSNSNGNNNNYRWGLNGSIQKQQQQQPMPMDLMRREEAPVNGCAGNTAQKDIICRTLLVNIGGSLGNFQLAGPTAAMWKPLAGREGDVFIPHLGADSASSINKLRTGIVRRVAIKEHYSTFPVTLGVTLNGIPPSEVTDLGERYAYTVLPGSRISSQQEVYRLDASSDESAAWKEQYPEWNQHNLEEQGILDVKQQPYVFIHERHPAIGVLRFNKDRVGCNIDEMPRMDNVWVRVTRQVLAEACQAIRSEVLSKVQTQDLSMFSVQLHRLNAAAWDDMSDIDPFLGFNVDENWTEQELANKKRNRCEQFLKTPFTYTARLEIEYEIASDRKSNEMLA